jgi:hypothetical protein
LAPCDVVLVAAHALGLHRRPDAGDGSGERVGASDVEDRLVLAGERGAGEVLGGDRRADCQGSVAEAGCRARYGVLARLARGDKPIRHLEAGGHEFAQVGSLRPRPVGVCAAQRIQVDDGRGGVACTRAH